MRSIGMIDANRLKNIPEKYRAKHEFCFHLHDLMATLLVQMEIQKAGHIEFEIESEEDRRLLASGIHILDFLDKSGRGDLGRVDKLGSQISFDLIQGSFYGGYRGAFVDGRRRVGVL